MNSFLFYRKKVNQKEKKRQRKRKGYTFRLLKVFLELLSEVSMVTESSLRKTVKENGIRKEYVVFLGAAASFSRSKMLTYSLCCCAVSASIHTNV